MPQTQSAFLAAVFFATLSLAQSPSSKPAAPTPTPDNANFETLGVSEDDPELAEIPVDSKADEVDRSSNVPQTYEIVRGDTLWDICKKILGDPWYWPKLWSLNEYISNPHLIYPGNLIKFYPGSEVAPPSLVIEGKGAQAQEEPPIETAPPKVAAPAVRDPEISFDKSLAHVQNKDGSMRLRPLAYVTRKKLDPIGKISYSSVPRIELILSDTAYLEFFNKTKVTVGDRYHIIETVQVVSDPDKSMHSYGTMYRKNAVLQVIAITGNVVEAKIVGGDRSVRRGDVFVPYVDEVRAIKPIDAKKNISAKIIATENQKILLSQNEYAFINAGKAQGVTEGMRFYVVKRGDGVFQGDDDEKLPFVVIGTCVVAEVFENNATIYVSDLKETLEVGMQVRSVVKR